MLGKWCEQRKHVFFLNIPDTLGVLACTNRNDRIDQRASMKIRRISLYIINRGLCNPLRYSKFPTQTSILTRTDTLPVTVTQCAARASRDPWPLTRSIGWGRCTPSWRTGRPFPGTAGGCPRRGRTAAPAGPRWRWRPSTPSASPPATPAPASPAPPCSSRSPTCTASRRRCPDRVRMNAQAGQNNQYTVQTLSGKERRGDVAIVLLRCASHLSSSTKCGWEAASCRRWRCLDQEKMDRFHGIDQLQILNWRFMMLCLHDNEIGRASCRERVCHNV